MWGNNSGNVAYEGYGVIPKILWGNRVFLSLSEPEDRLAYIYLRTGPEFYPSGLFYVDRASLAYAACFQPPEYETRLNVLEGRGLLRWYDGVVWLTGVREHYIKSATDEQLERATEQISRLDPENHVVIAYMEEFDLSPVDLLASSEMEAAVALVCKMSLALLSIEDKNICRLLVRAGYLPEQVVRAFGKGGLWYQHDWRGQKQPPQWPRVKNVREDIQRLLELDGVAPASTQKVDTERLQGMVVSLASAGKNQAFAQTEVSKVFGPQVWTKMLAHKDWHGWKTIPTNRIIWDLREALKNETGK
jgi:hypothetical protein